MKVKLIVNTFSEEQGYLRYGEIIDVSDDVAQRWFKHGVAVEAPADAPIMRESQANTLEVQETPAEAPFDGQNEPELAVADEDVPVDINTGEPIDIRTLDFVETEDVVSEPVAYADMPREELELAAEALGIKVTKAMRTDTIIKKLGEANDND